MLVPHERLPDRRQAEEQTAAAERMRRYRARRRVGSRCFRGDASRTVVASLIRSGWLSFEEALDPSRLGEVLIDLADCWIGGRLGPLGKRITARRPKDRC